MGFLHDIINFNDFTKKSAVYIKQRRKRFNKKLRKQAIILAMKHWKKVLWVQRKSTFKIAAWILKRIHYFN